MSISMKHSSAAAAIVVLMTLGAVSPAEAKAAKARICSCTYEMFANGCGIDCDVGDDVHSYQYQPVTEAKCQQLTNGWYNSWCPII